MPHAGSRHKTARQTPLDMRLRTMYSLHPERIDCTTVHGLAVSHGSQIVQTCAGFRRMPLSIASFQNLPTARADRCSRQLALWSRFHLPVASGSRVYQEWRFDFSRQLDGQGHEWCSAAKGIAGALYFCDAVSIVSIRIACTSHMGFVYSISPEGRSRSISELQDL